MTTTINLDFGAKDFKIPGLESKFDFIGVPNSFVRCFEEELNRFEITVLYQLLRWHSWSNSGVVLRKSKWIYKSVASMIEDAFRGIKPGKLYRALQKLVQLGYILREQLHREHYGDVHACAAYNRRNYYSPVMEKVMGCIVDTLTEQSPQNLENLGFSIMENQVCQNETTDFPKQKNNTHTTSTSKLSQTPSLTPQGAGESNQKKTVSQIPKDIQNKQQPSNPTTVKQKKINSNTTPFATVVQRPPRVEEKINEEKIVQDSVQNVELDVAPDVAQNSVQDSNVQEAVQVEVMPPPKRVERSSKRNQTPKGDATPGLSSQGGTEASENRGCPPSAFGHAVTRPCTKPNLDFGLAPWTSLEQFKQFYRALIKSLPIVANSRSPQGLANTIIQQLKQGIPHSYWDDFINGLSIGTSTQQEWEVEPGVAHPMFIEYLAEKLIKGNNSQTRETAIQNALDIASSPKQAIFFWKEFKISLGNALHEAERHRALGVQALPTPLWTKERPEPTLEEAANVGIKIALINSAECANAHALLSQSSEPVGSTQNAIEAAQNRQIEGSTQQIEPSIHNTSNIPLESDPWLDEEKPQKPRISDFASEDFKRKFCKGFNESKSEKRYAQPDQWRRQSLKIEQMNFAEINQALLDPILRPQLLPQLMLSDYQLITDELGRIIGIENQPL